MRKGRGTQCSNGSPSGRDGSSSWPREEAGRFRHDFVGTEHVLLGLIRDGEGIATAVLQRLGLRLETVKAEVERALAGFPKTLTFGEVPFTPAGQARARAVASRRPASSATTTSAPSTCCWA